MARRSAAAPAGARLPEPLFSVVVDYETFQRTCELARGSVVTPGSLVPWLDQAWVQRVVFDGPDRVKNVGVRRRLFTGATRTSVLVRERECFHPYCDIPACDCQVDHVVPYAEGGLTVDDNGRPACGFHNRQAERDRRIQRRRHERAASDTTDDAARRDSLSATSAETDGSDSPHGLRPIRRYFSRVTDRNVIGGDLEPCGTEPMTGFYRDGCCKTGPEDRGSHTICAVVTAEFLEHQRRIGNDLSTPMPQFQFPGLSPGDRWCVTAVNWLRAHLDGSAAHVVLASTHERALDIVPLSALQEHAVDVPADPGALEA